MGEYVWNWLNLIDNGFAMSSDFIVMVMTTVRYVLQGVQDGWDPFQNLIVERLGTFG